MTTRIQDLMQEERDRVRAFIAVYKRCATQNPPCFPLRYAADNRGSLIEQMMEFTPSVDTAETWLAACPPYKPSRDSRTVAQVVEPGSVSIDEIAAGCLSDVDQYEQYYLAMSDMQPEMFPLHVPEGDETNIFLAVWAGEDWACNLSAAIASSSPAPG